MPANKNKSDELLPLLNYKYLLLKAKMEATAKEIIAHGGHLPSLDTNFQIAPLNSNLLQEELNFKDNLWKDRVTQIMDSLARPCSAKEISEILHEGHYNLNISTIHVRVTAIMRFLIRCGLVEKQNHSKYLLKRNV